MGSITVAVIVIAAVIGVVLLAIAGWCFYSVWRSMHPKSPSRHEVITNINRAMRGVDEVFDRAVRHMEDAARRHRRRETRWSEWFD
jgi:hypothetical protein